MYRLGGGDRRSFLARAAAAALVATPVVCGQARAATQKVTIALTSKSSLSFLPLLLAERLGYFEAESVEVEFLELGSGARAVQAVRDGQADVVGESYEQTIALQRQSQFMRAFVLMARAPQVAMGVSSKTMPRLRSAQELRGRRIGVAAPGSSSDTLVRLVLQQAGMSAADVQLLELPAANVALTALRAGEIDAISYPEPLMTMCELRSDVRIIADMRTLKGTQELCGGPLPAACLVASDLFLQRQQAAAQAVANAVVHALKWLQTAGPSDMIKTVPEPFMLGDRGVYLAAFNKLRESIALDGMISDEGVRSAMRVQSRIRGGINPGQISLGRTFTNTFAARAKEKYQV